MKRTRKPEPVVEVPQEDTNKLHWRKIGGGSLRLPNAIIKSGQTFYAHEHEIPKAFRDMFECLDDKTTQHVKKAAAVADLPEHPETEAAYSVVPAGEGFDDLFNVVNENGKPINEQPMELSAAEDLKEQLEA